MARATNTQNNLFADIWHSFRSLPGWVQIWISFILVPVNMISLFFIQEPMGLWIAFLANVAMLPNLPVMLFERGFSRLMAWPHIIPWTVLVLLLLIAKPSDTGLYGAYLWVLLVVDLVSLMFDYPDAVKWLKGDRAVAGR